MNGPRHDARLDESEVAIRQNGQETAVDAPTLDGQMLVCLDAEAPSVHLPDNVAVMYHDGEPDDELAADGGTLDRSEVEMRGFGLEEHHAEMGIALSVVLLVGAGVFLFGSTAEFFGGVAMLFGGLLTGYVSVRSKWSGRS